MKNILILFAHPRLEDSVVNKGLMASVHELPFVTFHDLYETYPDFNINIESEKELLLQHDIIVWQHPLYWYSCPPLLKQWIDLVLEYGWAYGKNGEQLKGKWIFTCISAGGSYKVYQTEGRNRYTINQFLIPFEQTARLCNMTWLPPFVIHQSTIASANTCSLMGREYADILKRLANGELDPASFANHQYLNIQNYNSHA
jgi:glutathione-regulated potassium-efflux system ancillary protein KefG